MSKINIRESLRNMDADSCCKYDLLTMYDACLLTDEDKADIAKLLFDNEDPEVIYQKLCTYFCDDDVSELTGLADVQNVTPFEAIINNVKTGLDQKYDGVFYNDVAGQFEITSKDTTYTFGLSPVEYETDGISLYVDYNYDMPINYTSIKEASEDILNKCIEKVSTASQSNGYVDDDTMEYTVYDIVEDEGRLCAKCMNESTNSFEDIKLGKVNSDAVNELLNNILNNPNYKLTNDCRKKIADNSAPWGIVMSPGFDITATNALMSTGDFGGSVSFGESEELTFENGDRVTDGNRKGTVIDCDSIKVLVDWDYSDTDDIEWVMKEDLSFVNALKESEKEDLRDGNLTEKDLIDAGYKYVASNSPYDLYRKIVGGKGDWYAVNYENNTVQHITYAQARGYEPIDDTTGIKKLSMELGKKLLPQNESVDEAKLQMNNKYDKDIVTEGIFDSKETKQKRYADTVKDVFGEDVNVVANNVISYASDLLQEVADSLGDESSSKNLGNSIIRVIKNAQATINKTPHSLVRNIASIGQKYERESINLKELQDFLSKVGKLQNSGKDGYKAMQFLFDKINNSLSTRIDAIIKTITNEYGLIRESNESIQEVEDDQYFTKDDLTTYRAEMKKRAEGVVFSIKRMKERHPEYSEIFDNLTDELVDSMSSLKNESLEEDAEEDDDLISAEQEFDSAATSINSNKLPAVYSMVRFNPGDVVVDFGGGKFDNAVNYLKDQDVTLLVYDPYNRSAEHNKEVLRVLKEHGGADAAVNSNVLNVIKEPEAREAVLKNIKKITKRGAPIYITVYEGRGDGAEGPTKSGYQLNRKTGDYMDEVGSVFSNVKRKGKLITAINESTSMKESIVTDASNIGQGYAAPIMVSLVAKAKGLKKWVKEYKNSKDKDSFERLLPSFEDDILDYKSEIEEKIKDFDKYWELHKKAMLDNISEAVSILKDIGDPRLDSKLSKLDESYSIKDVKEFLDEIGGFTDYDGKIEELMDNFGMTKDEAESAIQCYVIEPDDDYVDDWRELASKSVEGYVYTYCDECGKKNRVKVTFNNFNEPFNDTEYKCKYCGANNLLTDPHSYDKNGNLVEASDDGGTGPTKSGYQLNRKTGDYMNESIVTEASNIGQGYTAPVMVSLVTEAKELEEWVEEYKNSKDKDAFERLLPKFKDNILDYKSGIEEKIKEFDKYWELHKKAMLDNISEAVSILKNIDIPRLDSKLEKLNESYSDDEWIDKMWEAFQGISGIKDISEGKKPNTYIVTFDSEGSATARARILLKALIKADLDIELDSSNGSNVFTFITPTNEWEFIKGKMIKDSDGFLTSYDWYRNTDSGLNIFMFGEEGADPDYADWETESDSEAEDWFNSYTGFDEE